MISVCYTVRNRTYLNTGKEILPLFYNSVMSVVDAFKENKIEYEFVISDWKSTDTDYKWLPKNNKVITIDPKIIQFSRGYGRNIAAENTSYDNILFLDTDMVVSDKFIKRCLDFVKEEKNYFPICWSLSESDRGKEHFFLENIKTDSKFWNNRLGLTGWRKTGTGNCLVSKSVWKNVGKWPQYTKWGKEDGDFYKKIKDKHITIRKNDPGLIHCWHPINRD